MGASASMCVEVMEYDLMMNSLQKKSDTEDAVSVYHLLAILILTMGLSIAELVLAQVTHSITLLVLVHQNIYNVLTLLVSCITKFKGDDESLKNTFGWRRMEVVGSISSLVFLFSLCFGTIIEALQTLFHTSHLDTFLTCSLVYYEVVTEQFSAYLDPIISIVYIVILIWTCIPMVKASSYILLQTIPGNVEFSVLKKFLLQKFPGILALHEFHVWTFTPGKLVLTGHIVYKDEDIFTEIHGQVETFFSSQGFSQVTIQPEFPPTPKEPDEIQEDLQSCTLKCKSEECEEMTCCKTEEGE